MFDFAPAFPAPRPLPASALFLSGPFGAAREWRGISGCLGTRALCQAFALSEEFQQHAEAVAGGVHLVAHGTGTYHVLRFAQSHPARVRSLTLIEPDLVEALPDLSADPQFWGQRSMIARVTEMEKAERRVEAAALVTDWWMGPGAWAGTCARLCERFTDAVPALIQEWQRQAAAPLPQADLAALSCPVRIVIGRQARSDTRALVRRLCLLLPQASQTRVAEARGAAHLTMPHVVGPEIANFVVSAERAWQTEPTPAAA